MIQLINFTPKGSHVSKAKVYSLEKHILYLGIVESVHQNHMPRLDYLGGPQLK